MNKLVDAIDQVIEENNLPHEWSKEISAELCPVVTPGHQGCNM